MIRFVHPGSGSLLFIYPGSKGQKCPGSGRTLPSDYSRLSTGLESLLAVLEFSRVSFVLDDVYPYMRQRYSYSVKVREMTSDLWIHFVEDSNSEQLSS
jgi:hypothetical protein